MAEKDPQGAKISNLVKEIKATYSVQVFDIERGKWMRF
jgi:hypothetical protein